MSFDLRYFRNECIAYLGLNTPPPMSGMATRKENARLIDIRKFDTLGHANHGWLDARHHFPSPAITIPTAWAGVRCASGTTMPSRRRPASRRTAPRHDHHLCPHRCDQPPRQHGRTAAACAAGDVEVMSAGTGVTHGEFNLEDEESHAVPDLDHRSRWRQSRLGPARISRPTVRDAS